MSSPALSHHDLPTTSSYGLQPRPVATKAFHHSTSIYPGNLSSTNYQSYHLNKHTQPPLPTPPKPTVSSIPASKVAEPPASLQSTPHPVSTTNVVELPSPPTSPLASSKTALLHHFLNPKFLITSYGGSLIIVHYSLFIRICSIVLISTTLIYWLKKWRIHNHQSLKVPKLDETKHDNLLYRKVYAYLNSQSMIEDSNNTILISRKTPNDLDDDYSIQGTAAEDDESRCKEWKLHMNTATLVDDLQSSRRWSSIRLSNRATFKTIAMDSDLNKRK
ncbi:hypothetical protein R6Q59_016968 [Mikania micrantha]